MYDRWDSADKNAGRAAFRIVQITVPGTAALGDIFAAPDPLIC